MYCYSKLTDHVCWLFFRSQDVSFSHMSHGGEDVEGSTRHSSRIRSQQAHSARTQPQLGARATSSDLAAAEALAELRHENEGESDEQSDMECEVGEEGGPRKGASGYKGIFRVTQPPLPLWVAGEAHL